MVVKIWIFLKNISSIIKFFAVNAYGIMDTLSKGERASVGNNEKSSVLIIANGPSLRGLNLVDLTSRFENVCCVNFFPLTEYFFKIKPNFMCLMDPFFYGDVDEDVVISDKLVKKYKRLVEILNKVDWDMTLIMRQGYKFVQIRNSKIKMEYLSNHANRFDCPKNLQYFIWKNNFATCGARNVTASATFYFILKRYGKLFLAGADFDEFSTWRIDERNHLIGTYKHFYDDGVVTHDYTAAGQCKMQDFSFYLSEAGVELQQFYYLREFADYQRVSVYNLNKNSFLDMFKKLPVEKFLSGETQKL